MIIAKKFFQLQDVLDRHKGRPAFVLGAGPSLRHLDPESIKPFVVIAVNVSITKFQNADYFFTCDSGAVLYKYWYVLKNLKCKIVLYDVGGEKGCFGHLEGKAMNKENVWEGIDRDRIRFFSYNKQNFVMNKSSCSLIEGSSSVHPAVNLAYLMGCNPIILSGCDCRYVKDDYHYCDCDMKLECKGYSHIHTYADYQKRIPREGDTDRILRGHVACWEKIRNQNPDVNIIDTSNGKLTMFPQMMIKEVIDKYGENKK